MGNAYRREANVDMTVLYEDIYHAKCGDPMDCTLGLCGLRTVGVPVEVLWNPDTGAVHSFWEKDNRMHRGIVTPHNKAFRILLLTDVNKHKLLRDVKKTGPIEVVITDHWSRLSQANRTPEEKEAMRVRKRELEKLRDLGLAPPPRKRTPSGAPVAPRRGSRFIEPVAAVLGG